MCLSWTREFSASSWRPERFPIASCDQDDTEADGAEALQSLIDTLTDSLVALEDEEGRSQAEERGPATLWGRASQCCPRRPPRAAATSMELGLLTINDSGNLLQCALHRTGRNDAANCCA